MSRRKREAPAGAVLNVTEEQYHADPCVRPSLSHSVAHELVKRSPLHAWQKHPKLGGGVREAFNPSAPYARGRILHKLILGKGAEIVAASFDDWRSAAAREIRDRAVIEGKLPVLAQRLEEYTTVAERVLGELAGAGYKLDGESEVAAQWTEPSEHGPVLCRCRFDHVFFADGLVLDLKSAEDASPRRTSRVVVDFGYDIQCVAYTRALEAIKPELVGRVQFKFVTFESEPPYAVVPWDLDGQFLEIGERRWRQAVEVWGRCLADGHWPSYSTELATLSPPPWVVAEHLGNWAE